MKPFLFITISLVISLSSYSQKNVNDYYKEKQEYEKEKQEYEKKQESLQEEIDKISNKPNKTDADKKKEKELETKIDSLEFKIAQLDTLVKNNAQNARIEKDMRKGIEKDRDKYKKERDRYKRERDSLEIEDDAKAKEIERMAMNVKVKCIEKLSNNKIRFAIKLFKPNGKFFNEHMEVQIAIAQMKEENKKKENNPQIRKRIFFIKLLCR